MKETTLKILINSNHIPSEICSAESRRKLLVQFRPSSCGLLKFIKGGHRTGKHVQIIPN